MYTLYKCFLQFLLLIIADKYNITSVYKLFLSTLCSHSVFLLLFVFTVYVVFIYTWKQY